MKNCSHGLLDSRKSSQMSLKSSRPRRLFGSRTSETLLSQIRYLWMLLLILRCRSPKSWTRKLRRNQITEITLKLWYTKNTWKRWRTRTLNMKNKWVYLSKNELFRLRSLLSSLQVCPKLWLMSKQIAQTDAVICSILSLKKISKLKNLNKLKRWVILTFEGMSLHVLLILY